MTRNGSGNGNDPASGREPGGRSASSIAVEQATAVQRQAAVPETSSLLRASAGAGKTKVLVDRFIRLCLAGSRPKTILAVTFTKKAAVEIKDRLLRRAQRYATLPASALDEELALLLGSAPTPVERERAARLHAEILEDFSGLHVGTIHSFCQLVLSRFAAEVGLDPRFEVLEQEDELWREAIDHLEREVATDTQARAELAALAASPDGARRQLTRLRHDRVHLERWLERKREEAGSDEAAGPLATPRSPLLPALAADLQAALFAGTSLADQAAPQLIHLAEPALAAAAELAGTGLPGILAQEADATPALSRQVDQMRAGLVAACERLRGDPTERAMVTFLAEVRELLLTKSGTLRKLKGKRDRAADRNQAFAEMAAGLLGILYLADLVELFQHNLRLLRHGLRALDIYDDLKRRDRCVDFQDLERLAWSLLRSEQGLYIQYRLDEAIDHLLIDEFQDTNRNQWEILRPFAEEFLAGESARKVRRTVFLVGDAKQSIYGFRGAEPAIFGEVAAWLERQTGQAVLSLPTNFRSLPAVVNSVGRLMNAEPLASLLSPGEAGSTRQAVARNEGPGQVYLLPVYRPADGESDGDRLAAAAAVSLVQHLVAEGRSGSAERGSPMGYGDILVLCRNRSHIAVYEQAFRRAGIPILPAGRGMLARSREVRDILAVLRWLTYPGDDTALASVLRSPLFRLSEETLQRALARMGGAGTAAAGGTAGSLWQVLQHAPEEFGLDEAVARLKDWRKSVGFKSCPDLLRHIYRTGHVLERFVTALGEQARYNLLRLHDLALSPALGDYPTLRRFAALIERAAETAAEEEATPPEHGTGRLRLMTVHGAKGLQAPVVLLVDADAVIRDENDRLSLVSDQVAGPLVYGVRSQYLNRPGAVESTAPPGSALEAAGQRARAFLRREEANILYVAMTRAQDALFILGAEAPRKGNKESYLDWLQAAARADAEAGSGSAQTTPYSLEPPAWLEEKAQVGPSRVQPPGDSSAALNAAGALADQLVSEPPAEYRYWQPPQQSPAFSVGRPSAGDETVAAAVTGAAPVADDVEDLAVERPRSKAIQHGEAVHLYLQLAAEQGEMPAGDGAAWDEARAVFANPDFAWIFQPESVGGVGYAEVPVLHRLVLEGDTTGEVATERRSDGRIDRLVLRPGRADIIDYKSTTSAGDEGQLPALREKYRRQLAAYREAVAALHPEREVRAHLLFTYPSGKKGRGRLVSL